MNRHSGTPALLNYFPRTFYAACQSCGRTFLGLLTAWPAALLPAFAAFLLLTSGTASAQDSVESDRAVLVALYNATDGPNWTGNTDLPPRTSPPSMLDPGPFEVHSKGLDPVPAT